MLEIFTCLPSSGFYISSLRRPPKASRPSPDTAFIFYRQWSWIVFLEQNNSRHSFLNPKNGKEFDNFFKDRKLDTAFWSTFLTNEHSTKQLFRTWRIKYLDIWDAVYRDEHTYRPMILMNKLLWREIHADFIALRNSGEKYERVRLREQQYNHIKERPASSSSHPCMNNTGDRECHRKQHEQEPLEEQLEQSMKSLEEQTDHQQQFEQTMQVPVEEIDRCQLERSMLDSEEVTYRHQKEPKEQIHHQPLEQSMPELEEEIFHHQEGE
ncbi:hypothetical protein BDA99DRAFT_566559 [Phascolomyces articulosus]|uniref:Uncharacterized protein n=1 Tax=Phascolomyces articulosus TaxID=60185 RepID=A0AAD5JLL9_9FUNG|nr:hypothetical protein BDA99DRAFT_566559 [Phascolomyces articulosus]